MLRKFNIPPGADLAKQHTTKHAYTDRWMRNAILAAHARVVREAEIRAQHGPVRILMREGKPVGDTQSV